MSTLTMAGTDLDLRDRVQRQLEFDPEVEEANVAVSVSDGVVTLAGFARTPRQAVFGTALLSMTLCWLNWGMGLIASAVLVRMMARRHPGADYRLLVAAAYLGLGTTWHGGPSPTPPWRC